MQKKFYWVKLAIDFFNDDSIDSLLSKPHGCEYVIVYQMLILLSANYGGYLATQINGQLEPMDILKMTRETKHFDKQIIVEALKQFKDLGLLDIITKKDDITADKGLYHIVNINNMIGQETKSAIDKRKYRENKAKKKAESNKKPRSTKKPTEGEAKNLEELTRIAKTPWIDTSK